MYIKSCSFRPDGESLEAAMLEMLQATVLWEQRNERHYTWQHIQFLRHHCDRWASSGGIIVSWLCGSLLIIDSWGTEWTPCECIKIHLKVHSPQLKSQPPKRCAFVTPNLLSLPALLLRAWQRGMSIYLKNLTDRTVMQLSGLLFSTWNSLC